MVKDLVAEASSDGADAWRHAVAELQHDRAAIELEVLAEGGELDAAHEWAAFLASVELAV
jgi:hypothetical protein